MFVYRSKDNVWVIICKSVISSLLEPVPAAEKSRTFSTEQHTTTGVHRAYINVNRWCVSIHILNARCATKANRRRATLSRCVRFTALSMRGDFDTDVRAADAVWTLGRGRFVPGRPRGPRQLWWRRSPFPAGAGRWCCADDWRRAIGRGS